VIGFSNCILQQTVRHRNQ